MGHRAGHTVPSQKYAALALLANGYAIAQRDNHWK